MKTNTKIIWYSNIEATFAFKNNYAKHDRFKIRCQGDPRTLCLINLHVNIILITLREQIIK